MKHGKLLLLILTAALALSVAQLQRAQAATAQTNNVYQFGGSMGYGANVPLPYLTIPKSTAIPTVSSIVLTGGANPPGGGNQFQTLVKAGTGTTQYQVNAGKTLFCYGFYIHTSSGNTVHVLFGYGTAALASADTGTVPTGATYYGSTSTAGSSPFRFTASTNETPEWFPIPITFPASSYPFIRSSNSVGQVGATLLCDEF